MQASRQAIPDPALPRDDDAAPAAPRDHDAWPPGTLGNLLRADVFGFDDWRPRRRPRLPPSRD